MGKKLVFMIPTYNRADALKKLLPNLVTLGDVFVLQDGGDDDYSFCIDCNNVHFFVNRLNNGKERFYDTVNTLFDLVRDLDYDYYFFLPDDLLPVPDFHSKSIKLWNQIKDPRKICLNLFLEQSRIGKPCWTKFTPIDIGNVYITQWVDMCFMAEKKFFDFLHWHIPPVKTDWIIDPLRGSGVGSKISHRLYEACGMNMYQVKSSLFVSTPACFDSKMNPNQKNILIHKEVI